MSGEWEITPEGKFKYEAYDQIVKRLRLLLKSYVDKDNKS